MTPVELRVGCLNWPHIPNSLSFFEIRELEILLFIHWNSL